jgi:hypothetical protein
MTELLTDIQVVDVLTKAGCAVSLAKFVASAAEDARKGPPLGRPGGEFRSLEFLVLEVHFAAGRRCRSCFPFRLLGHHGFGSD